jgi:DNA-directed RNA polymerase beta' subunit
MNMHLPQSLETMTELKMLAAVPTQIVIPKNNSPVITIKQDTLVGAFRFTSNKFTVHRQQEAVPNGKIRIRRKDAMNMMMGVRGFRGVLPPPSSRDELTGEPYWSGKDLFAAILPPVYIDMTGSDIKDEKVHITPRGYKNEGKYVAPVGKDVINKGTKGLIHQIYVDYGQEACTNFLDSIQNMIVVYLIQSGFSVGLSDLIADQITNEDITKIITKNKEQVAEVIRSLHSGGFENNTSKTNQEVFEERVNAQLNKAVKEAGNVGTDSLAWDNRMTNMIKAGSKGSTLNISQMIACVGQVNVDGKRIPYGYTGRTLPHFQRYDDTPEARGFVENSFVRGLTPTEFFFHAMSGREGLIDTAVKTSQTGYVQRQMIKAMEDLKVHYDYTVRTANGAIVQTVYGQDCMDSINIISQPLPSLKKNVYQIFTEYVFSPEDCEEARLSMVCMPRIVAELQNPDTQRILLERSKKMGEQIVEDRDTILMSLGKLEDNVNYSVPFDRIVRKNTNLDTGLLSNLNPLEIFEGLDELEQLSIVNDPKNEAGMLMMSLARVHLNPKVLLFQRHCTKAQFTLILQEVKERFLKSLIHPGEMVGVIAAQSIGEPSTQMTLNSFHYNTELLVKWNGKLMKKTIGDMVEDYFKKDDIKTEEHPNDTHLVYSKEEDIMEVLSPDLKGNVKWRKVEALTKHPVVNVDGTNTLVKVSTRGGREVIATKAKSFVRYNKETKELEEANGCDVCVGDLVPIHAKGFTLNEEEKQDKSSSQYNLLTKTHEEMLRWIQDKMNIQTETENDSSCIKLEMKRTTGSQETDLKLIQLLLLQINDIYSVKIDDSTLVIPSQWVSRFTQEEKSHRFDKIDYIHDVILDEIVKIEEIPNDHPYVYDLTIEETRLFQTFDGLAIRDTFHLAGVAEKSNVIRGIPRLNEILHLSKNLKGPSVTVYLSKEDRLLRERADTLRKKLMRTTMRDLVSEVRVYYDTQVPKELPTTIAVESDIVKSQWRMAMDIDPLALHDRGITMEILYIAVMKALMNRLNDVIVETTDTNEPTLKLTFSILSTDDVANDEASDAIRLFNELETIIMDKVVIQGIRGIEYCTLRKLNHSLVQEDHEFKEIEEFVVDTVGSNLLEILGTPGVDATRTYTNHIVEVNEVLGIHAARNSILREIVDVFEDTYINQRHLLLLADLMTHRGKLMSIDRHGVNRSDAGPLAKASFEETDTMLTKAAVQGELDPVTGVTSNIMFGQPIYGGTGMSQILLDETLYEKTFRPPTERSVDPLETDVVDVERETYCDTRTIRLTSLPVGETGADFGGEYDDIQDDF